MQISLQLSVFVFQEGIAAPQWAILDQGIPQLFDAEPFFIALPWTLALLGFLLISPFGSVCETKFWPPYMTVHEVQYPEARRGGGGGWLFRKMVYHFFFWMTLTAKKNVLLGCPTTGDSHHLYMTLFHQGLSQRPISFFGFSNYSHF